MPRRRTVGRCNIFFSAGSDPRSDLPLALLTAFSARSALEAARCRWERMFHFYMYRCDEFLGHYHGRFQMTKAKSGATVRSNTPAAQHNEVLCKVLCHNLRCLVQSTMSWGRAEALKAS